MTTLLEPGASATPIARGFAWAEGPLWVERLGGLLVSDVVGNTIWLVTRESTGWTKRLFLRPSGYAGPSPPGREHGANGLALDADARVVLCSHGERAVYRLDETRWLKHPLLTRVGGRRLNSPNDVARNPATGALYVTDPPYGLDDDGLRELDACGVYRIDPDGDVALATDALDRPNGVGFSPDGRTAYVSCSDDACPGWWAFPVRDDGTFGERTLFHDAAPYLDGSDQAMPDGFAVDDAGRVWAAGPLGLHVFAPDGAALGTMAFDRKTSNCAFGEDGRSLFVTATDRIVRLRLAHAGPVG